MYNMWDIYYAKVAFEDDPSKSEDCPILIISDNLYVVLASKITHQEPRTNDKEDYVILDWEGAGLKEPSALRVRRTTKILKQNLYYKIGTLQKIDRNRVWDLIKNKK